MKIALGLEYPLTMRGGVSVLVEKLIEGISANYDVVLVSPDPLGFRPERVCHHVHWDPAAASRRTSRALADTLAGLGVSLAHLHAGGNFGWGSRLPGQSPFPFLKRNGIVGVSTIHVVLSVLDGYCDPNKPGWFKLALLPVVWLGKLDELRNVGAEIVISQRGYERVRRWYWPLRGRFHRIYHSRLEASPPAPQSTAREPMILCVGHLAQRKGQHTLAAAFASIAAAHPGWKLAIIGHAGPDDCLAQIQRIIAERQLPDRILLLGSRDDALDFMRRASIFVQPSVFEGLPLALQEAMFCGCACVATRVLGNDELIEHGRNGVLVPPLEPVALACALDNLIRDATQRETLGRAAAASIIERGMTARSMIERYIALYKSLGLARDQSALMGGASGSGPAQQPPDSRAEREFQAASTLNASAISTRD